MDAGLNGEPVRFPKWEFNKSKAPKLKYFLRYKENGKSLVLDSVPEGYAAETEKEDDFFRWVSNELVSIYDKKNEMVDKVEKYLEDFGKRMQQEAIQD